MIPVAALKLVPFEELVVVAAAVVILEFAGVPVISTAWNLLIEFVQAIVDEVSFT
ncbi:hypothetical protein [Natrialbaceae archaeon AArc-T1-2]|uniref:hypothetical protein n=1 Tax=Natrialbaceae archaeon AArc-T1-2 TaxID=3053904 RepID=UPI00255ADC34|nr:hypothetical protein [Natrialbaceae archaeon AArc-T1-2]WIV66561.1 hypothetical protein QQ977_12790 [Natrialbaceae archaeon AArc-T1-2]